VEVLLEFELFVGLVVGTCLKLLEVEDVLVGDVRLWQLCKETSTLSVVGLKSHITCDT